MNYYKNIIFQSLHRGSHGSSSSDVSTDKNSKDHKEQKDQKEHKSVKETWHSGRPRSGSESSRNPVSKVMDLIRHRSHSALNSDDKRKSVSNTFRFLLQSH